MVKSSGHVALESTHSQVGRTKPVGTRNVDVVSDDQENVGQVDVGPSALSCVVLCKRGKGQKEKKRGG